MTPRASSFLLLVPAGLLLTTIVTAPASVRAQWQGSWSPDDYGDIPKFEQAVACYDEVHDEYVIAAVFQGMIAYGGLLRDQLHVLRIGGNASSPDYGEVVDALYVEGRERIDNIDCASDGGKVFVAYDSRFEPAAWFSVEKDKMWIDGPYDIRLDHCSPWTHRPRIAAANGRVIVAVEGYDYGTEVASSEICAQQFAWDKYYAREVPDTETLIAPDPGSPHTDFDIEWGDTAFILTAPYWPDWLDPSSRGRVSTFAIDFDNTLDPLTWFPPENILQDVDDADGPGWPTRVKIVRTLGPSNPDGTMFIRTDTGSFWIDGDGAALDEPLADGWKAEIAACEYNGPDEAVATVFEHTSSWEYIGSYPTGVVVTITETTQDHYGTSRDYAYESMLVDTDIIPESCASSTAKDDRDVLLVTRSATGVSADVEWMILPP